MLRETQWKNGMRASSCLLEPFPRLRISSPIKTIPGGDKKQHRYARLNSDACELQLFVVVDLLLGRLQFGGIEGHDGDFFDRHASSLLTFVLGTSERRDTGSPRRLVSRVAGSKRVLCDLIAPLALATFPSCSRISCHRARRQRVSTFTDWHT